MKTITDQLFEAAGELIKLQPEVSDNTGHYHMADDGGVESEVGEFLYGLVRVFQPEAILETGTYTGVSAMYMGQALKDNGHGILETIEVDKFHIDRATKLFQKVDVAHLITTIHGKSLDFDPDREYDLMFLDSEPEFRFLEVVKFFKYLNPGGFIFIHDLHRHLSQHSNEKFFGWPFSEIPDTIKGWIREDKLRVISFPTPRGFTGFYRPTEDDYNPDNEKFKNKDLSGL